MLRFLQEQDRENQLAWTILWFVPYLLILTVFYGVMFGVPLAVKVYDLSLEGEVKILFMFMPFVYFYYMVPLLIAAAFFYNKLPNKRNTLFKVVYVVVTPFILAILFYGIGISTYYS